MSTDVESLMAQARDIACAAGQLTLEFFQRSDLAVDAKSDGTEVTDADRGAERLVRERLAAAYPDDAVFGEEEGGAVRPGGRTWIVDPIDGTRGFVRGVPLYSTLLALVDDDGPVVGVIDLPALGLTMAAGRGIGCWLGDHRCRVSDHEGLEGALVNTSSYETFDDHELSRLRSSGAMMRTWGDAYGYFLVASGQAEAMVDPICSTWDLAPMPVILAEAGGRFTDLSDANSFTNGNGLATNGRVHAPMLEVMGLR
ncbi:MAG: inositol monophosphatase family protein [Actinomycetota bacterium]|nr:inositol monophosphatase family protein [Actinomycetota bacterium]